MRQMANNFFSNFSKMRFSQDRIDLSIRGLRHSVSRVVGYKKCNYTLFPQTPYFPLEGGANIMKHPVHICIATQKGEIRSITNRHRLRTYYFLSYCAQNIQKAYMCIPLLCYWFRSHRHASAC